MARKSTELVGSDGSMQAFAERLVERSRAEGIELTGADGLLTALMRTVLQTGLEVEMADHLGYESGDRAGSRFGELAERVLDENGGHGDR